MTIMDGASIWFLFPWSLAIFMAASFASHPELQKNTDERAEMDVIFFASKHCS
jgi:hypothetical protein